ncbi:MAG: PolC-type DNA polymerase III [Lachnospiraceae bacterium]|nr:PolC-type DNA polymerase III [Lachnospiraceae bacterium]
MPELKTSDSIMQRMDEIVVERLTMPRDRSMLRVYLHAPFLIQKRDIFALEAAVKQTYFKTKPVTVRVYEHFTLKTLSPKEAFEAYRDSILLELKTFHLLEYNLFRNSSLEFTGEAQADLYVPDKLVSVARGKELEDYLESVFRERLGMSVSIRTCTREKQVQNQMESSLEGEISQIARQYREAQEEEKIRREEEAARNNGQTEKKYDKKRKLLASEGIGLAFEGEPVDLSEIVSEMGQVIIQGEIFRFEQRELKNKNLLYTFAVTDRTDSIKVKLFVKPEEKELYDKYIYDGAFVKINGVAVMDRFDREVAISAVSGILPAGSDRHQRLDTAPVKRVELHAHTQMSEMDAVMHTDKYIERAASWGHPAVAITDHGVVQSFPAAYHKWQDLKGKGKDIKIIYGCEGYLVDDKPGMTREEILRAKTYHIILLAANETGRVNLYRLVSESHLKYFQRRPRMLRSLIAQYRDGILLGSACEAGELFRALEEKADADTVAGIVNFYDYLEVQPIGNNMFLTRNPKNRRKHTVEELKDYVRQIVALGKQFGKPVCATCDVHFLDPEDEIYRRIIQKGMGYEDADEQPPLYFRTTEEMLAEFEFLGHETAQEIVIENPNRIAEQIEVISPVRPDKCPPKIEGAEEELERMCYEKAHEWYGDPLPDIVKERLDKELKSIIGNSYAVMYIIAQRLVAKSNQDGYLVGSRGSVGSSFVATMSGITEVNPLKPHYRCPNCRHSIFDNEETRIHAGGAGVDMKDMDCPVCGTRMIKDGYDIPFETFLGFKGDKEPDIDLNFSGEYQSQAHKYTEVLFGEGCTFKAGTISGIAEKTAFGFALKYFEERGESKRNCEIERLAKGCEGTRRTTGQHPGGIVVMPRGENIYSFTPIQHPANDPSTDIVTTHFDYHSIDHNLLKLDILGHDDPTMIKRLEELIGIHALDIPLDDPDVISLFKSCSALGIRSEDIGGCPLGTLGVPEFGTDFAMQIVLDAKPTCLADLVRIAGIAHGTNVWLGNVQDLILSGTTNLAGAICTRDDIMLYLISMGMDASMAFSIMESVRKGKVAKGKEKKWPQWKQEMEAHSVPDWYIGSCEKIQYMFPKAHAAAYVMMAWRVAYCKVHHPLEYYTAYFSVRADGFDYEMMCLGHENLARHLEKYRKNQDNLSDTEKRTLRDMRIVEEMFARGFEFIPIDLYRARADRFQIFDGKIMPSFNSIAGMGLKAAQSLEEAAARGRFLSREDMIQRAHISTTMADTLADLGLLGAIPKSNQLSFEELELL